MEHGDGPQQAGKQEPIQGKEQVSTAGPPGLRPFGTWGSWEAWFLTVCPPTGTTAALQAG